MKKIILGVMAAGAMLTACNKKENTVVEETVVKSDTLSEPLSDGHNAQNSLDWAGTYEATLPCADCPGIKTTVTLNDDGTFKHVSEYLERDGKFESTGTIMWHNDGSVVHLKGKDIDTKLKVIENGLIGLDQEGKEIDGALKEHYYYKKIN